MTEQDRQRLIELAQGWKKELAKTKDKLAEIMLRNHQMFEPKGGRTFN